MYQQLLQLRARHIVPHLPGTRALGCEVLGDKAVSARWQLGNGSELRIDLNLGGTAVNANLPTARWRLFDTGADAHPDTSLTAHSCVVSLIPSGLEPS